MRNKTGPNIEPCGKPLSTSAQSDVIPLTQTLWRLFFNHSVIQPCRVYRRFRVLSISE